VTASARGPTISLSPGVPAGAACLRDYGKFVETAEDDRRERQKDLWISPQEEQTADRRTEILNSMLPSAAERLVGKAAGMGFRSWRNFRNSRINAGSVSAVAPDLGCSRGPYVE